MSAIMSKTQFFKSLKLDLTIPDLCVKPTRFLWFSIPAFSLGLSKFTQPGNSNLSEGKNWKTELSYADSNLFLLLENWIWLFEFSGIFCQDFIGGVQPSLVSKSERLDFNTHSWYLISSEKIYSAYEYWVPSLIYSGDRTLYAFPVSTSEFS